MKPTPTHHQEPLMVALRVRPMNSSENKAGVKQIAFAVDKKLVVLMDPNDDNDDILRANRSREKKYIFDQTFNQQSTQRDIYDATVKAKSMVERVLNGYNCTVFAYGATGSGKTHTMLGTVREPGIMMLTLNDLYTKIEETKEEMTYKVSMAYVEIYNETVRDLLKGGQVLDLRDDSKGEVTISGLLDLEIHSTSDIMALLSRGNQLRTSEPTAANDTSSRSHALLKVSVEQRSKTMNVKQEVKSSVLFMVDLAGSERAAVTQNRGMRMIEGGHINRSLLALANCINALTTGHHNFVNYRDSKLTRLLKEALGGNCMTVMIAHISPSSTVFEESRNTLVYAERTKRIKNKTRQNVVDVNYHVTEYKHMIDSLNLQVKTLQRELKRQYLSHDPEVTQLCEQLKTCSQEEKEIRKEILILEYHLLQNAVEYQKHLASIKEWEQRHNLPTSLSTLSTTANSQEHKDTFNKEAHKPKELRNEELSTEEQFNSAYVESSEPTSSNEQSEPLYSRPAEDNNVKSTVKLKSWLFLPPLRPNVVAMEESITTPDSGELPAAEIEPVWVSKAREEMAVLMADKQRMEDDHHELQKRHDQSMVKMTRVKQIISHHPGLQPSLKQLMDILCHSCQTEGSAAEHSVAASLMSIQLGHHESLIQQLLTHSSALLGVVMALHTTIGEMGMALPEDMGSKVKKLGDKQRELRAQVEAEQQMPLISKKMEIPYLAKVSATLYSCVTGSKSNLDDSVPGNTDPVVSLSNVQMLSTQPSLQAPIIDSLSILPSLSTATLTSMSQLIPSFLQLSTSSSVHRVRQSSLPISIDSPLATSSMAAENKRTSNGVTKPLSDSSLNHILLAAKAKRNDGKASIVANNVPPKIVLNRVRSLSNATSIPTSKRKYIVHTSTSRDWKGPSCEIQQLATLKKKFSGSKLKKLPMDQLVTLIQSKHKSDVGVKEHTFRIPRTSTQKLKPIHIVSARKRAEPKTTGSSSDESLTLLQSNKKLSQISQANNGRVFRKPLPLPTHKVLFSGQLTNSPYFSPVRATIHNQHGSPKRSHSKRKNAWK